MQNSPEFALRCELAAAHRLAVMEGLNEGTWNHFSVKLPDEPDKILLTPGCTHWSQVRASNLALMDGAGKHLAGPTEPNGAAWIIHYPIHRARPDAQCLMHVHAPYITSLSMRKAGKLDTQSSQMAAQFHDDVAYFELYDGVLQEEEEGERMAEALGDKRVLLMRNHGALIAGSSIGRAYLDLYILERACMYQVMAVGEGHALQAIPEAVASETGRLAREESSDAHFNAMRQVLDQRESDYIN